jgi:hypothetical protein
MALSLKCCHHQHQGLGAVTNFLSLKSGSIDMFHSMMGLVSAGPLLLPSSCWPPPAGLLLLPALADRSGCNAFFKSKYRFPCTCIVLPLLLCLHRLYLPLFPYYAAASMAHTCLALPLSLRVYRRVCLLRCCVTAIPFSMLQLPPHAEASRAISPFQGAAVSELVTASISL